MFVISIYPSIYLSIYIYMYLSICSMHLLSHYSIPLFYPPSLSTYSIHPSIHPFFLSSRHLEHEEYSIWQICFPDQVIVNLQPDWLCHPLYSSKQSTLILQGLVYPEITTNDPNIWSKGHSEVGETRDHSEIIWAYIILYTEFQRPWSSCLQ